jgi:hypothetical protein
MPIQPLRPRASSKTFARIFICCLTLHYIRLLRFKDEEEDEDE